MDLEAEKQTSVRKTPVERKGVLYVLVLGVLIATILIIDLILIEKRRRILLKQFYEELRLDEDLAKINKESPDVLYDADGKKYVKYYIRSGPGIFFPHYE